VEPRTVEEAIVAYILFARSGIPTFVLGGGTNTLAPDGVLEGAVVACTRLVGAAVDGTRIRALAGTSLRKVSRLAEEAALSGLEPFALIPGTIGGAVCGNAGGPRDAGTVGDRVARVRVLSKEGELAWRDRSDLGFHYRGSSLVGSLVLEVELERAPDRRELVRARWLDAARRKAEKQPLASLSAGCVFRNPPGDSAGRLIEACGQKGARRGGARVSPKHANFIVNEARATAKDVLELAAHVRRVVLLKTGHDLIPELRLLGSEAVA
jgi:UDP-N-acetylmuramate dehydrogenase